MVWGGVDYLRDRLLYALTDHDQRFDVRDLRQFRSGGRGLGVFLDVAEALNHFVVQGP